MSTLLVKNARVLVTMDEERREIPDGGLHAVNGFIDQVGPTMDLPPTADDVVDLTGHVVLPGLINTHHHFYQTLTRAVPGSQDVGLFDWLAALYPMWARLTPGDVFVSTQVALAELALSGCTTAADHLYVFPNGTRLDDQIEAAETIGLRISASRGSMSLGESKGGLPPDTVVDEEDVILSDTARVIDAFHDPARGSMVQIAVSPCSPFSVTEDLMRESAALARDRGVRLHTHLAETVHEEEYTKETHGVRPVEWMEQLDWAGPDVWFAHCVHVHHGEINRMANDGHECRPLPHLQHASGFRRASRGRTARSRGSGGAGRRRVGVERRRSHAGRGTTGNAVGAPRCFSPLQRGPSDGRAWRARACHARWGTRPRPERSRLARTGEMRRLRRRFARPHRVRRSPCTIPSQPYCSQHR